MVHTGGLILAAEDMLKPTFLIHLIIITKNYLVTLCIRMRIKCLDGLYPNVSLIISFNDMLQTILEKMEFKNKPNESNVGYIFEVEKEYPKHLHKLNDECPFAPERIT